MLLIGVAVLTVVLSWTVVNTVYTLRYADLHFRSGGVGIAFGDRDGQEQPTYRDFAYVAFTIGMCYQVSDTTVRDRRIRGTVLSQAFLSYLFGVVIVAGSVNLIAGLPTDHRRPAPLGGQTPTLCPPFRRPIIPRWPRRDGADLDRRIVDRAESAVR